MSCRPLFRADHLTVLATAFGLSCLLPAQAADKRLSFDEVSQAFSPLKDISSKEEYMKSRAVAEAVALKSLANKESSDGIRVAVCVQLKDSFGCHARSSAGKGSEEESGKGGPQREGGQIGNGPGHIEAKEPPKGVRTYSGDKAEIKALVEELAKLERLLEVNGGIQGLEKVENLLKRVGELERKYQQKPEKEALEGIGKILKGFAEGLKSGD